MLPEPPKDWLKLNPFAVSKNDLEGQYGIFKFEANAVADQLAVKICQFDTWSLDEATALLGGYAPLQYEGFIGLTRVLRGNYPELARLAYLADLIASNLSIVKSEGRYNPWELISWLEGKRYPTDQLFSAPPFVLNGLDMAKCSAKLASSMPGGGQPVSSQESEMNLHTSNADVTLQAKLSALQIEIEDLSSRNHILAGQLNDQGAGASTKLSSWLYALLKTWYGLDLRMENWPEDWIDQPWHDLQEMKVVGEDQSTFIKRVREGELQALKKLGAHGPPNVSS